MSATAIADTVARALEELEQVFPGAVTHEPDGTGGAYVTVAGCELGDRWTRPVAAVSFHVPFNYPWAAIYPYYLPGDAWPVGPAPPALQRIVWRGREVVQVSLRHNQWNPQIDNALGSVRQVLHRLRQQT